MNHIDEIIHEIKMLNCEAYYDSVLSETGTHVEKHIDKNIADIEKQLSSKVCRAKGKTERESSFYGNKSNVLNMLSSILIKNINEIQSFCEKTRYNEDVINKPYYSPECSMLRKKKMSFFHDFDKPIGKVVIGISNKSFEAKRCCIVIGANIGGTRPFNLISAYPVLNEEQELLADISVRDELDKNGIDVITKAGNTIHSKYKDMRHIVKYDCIEKLTKSNCISVGGGYQNGKGEGIVLMNQNGNKKYIVNSLQQKSNKKYNIIPVEKNDVLVKAKYENNKETILFFRLGKPVDGRCIAKCVNIKEDGKWSFPPQRIYLSGIHVAIKLSQTKGNIHPGYAANSDKIVGFSLENPALQHNTYRTNMGELNPEEIAEKVLNDQEIEIINDNFTPCEEKQHER